MLWSWRCYGHFGHKRLRGISIVFNRFSKILNDFVRFSAVFSNFSRFSAILDDLQRFWAISGVLGTLLGALGRCWGALGRSWAPLGRLLDASWTPLGKNLGGLHLLEPNLEAKIDPSWLQNPQKIDVKKQIDFNVFSSYVFRIFQ